MQEVNEEWKRQKKIRTNTNICLVLFSPTHRQTCARSAYICNRHSHLSQSFGDVAEFVRCRHRCSLAYTRIRFVHGWRAPHRISIQFLYARNPAHTQRSEHSSLTHQVLVISSPAEFPQTFCWIYYYCYYYSLVVCFVLFASFLASSVSLPLMELSDQTHNTNIAFVQPS